MHPPLEKTQWCRKPFPLNSRMVHCMLSWSPTGSKLQSHASSCFELIWKNGFVILLTHCCGHVPPCRRSLAPTPLWCSPGRPVVASAAVSLCLCHSSCFPDAQNLKQRIEVVSVTNHGQGYSMGVKAMRPKTNKQTTTRSQKQQYRETERDRERERERENSNSNLKTLFYKDCSLGSVKNLSNN